MKETTVLSVPQMAWCWWTRSTSRSARCTRTCWRRSATGARTSTCSDSPSGRTSSSRLVRCARTLTHSLTHSHSLTCSLYPSKNICLSLPLSTSYLSLSRFRTQPLTQTRHLHTSSSRWSGGDNLSTPTRECLSRTPEDVCTHAEQDLCVHLFLLAEWGRKIALKDSTFQCVQPCHRFHLWLLKL